MSEAINGRRGFLRGLVTLPLIGGGVSLIGAPSAVAEPITPALLAAYRRWLEMEQYLLFEEIPEQPPARARLSLEGRSGSDVAAILRAEERLDELYADIRARWHHFRARAQFGGEVFRSPVDRLYLTRDMAIVSPPASTRAALVLSAVGCDWRNANV
jgi:hypothetical protein